MITYNHRFLYESLFEFVQAAKELPTPRSIGSERQEWQFGTEFTNREKTVTALEEGRAPAIVRDVAARVRGSIEHAMEACDLLGYSARRKTVWTDSGEPDTDRVLEGRENWAGESRRGKQTRIIRLGVNCLMSYGNSEQHFGKLIGTTCAVADALVKLGHGVEIVGMMAGTRLNNYDAGYVYTFPVKQSRDPMDIEAVGSIGLPGLMRDLTLSLAERDLGRNEWNGACFVNEAELRSIAGIDYLMTQSWTGMDQLRIFEGITKILQTTV